MTSDNVLIIRRRMFLHLLSSRGTRHGSCEASHLDFPRLQDVLSPNVARHDTPNQVYANMIFLYVLRILNGTLYILLLYF